jgi:hypothetical protein
MKVVHEGSRDRWGKQQWGQSRAILEDECTSGYDTFYHYDQHHNFLFTTWNKHQLGRFRGLIPPLWLLENYNLEEVEKRGV